MLVAPASTTLENGLANRIAEARLRTDELFRIVKEEALYDRPIPERHRIIFYIGHLEAFDWNLLRERLLATKPFNPGFDQLFAFGIDPVGDGLPSDQPSDWPSLAEVRNYVSRIRETLDAGIDAVLQSRGQPASPENDFVLLLNVAIEHRLMHAETLAYMLHQLPLDRKLPQPSAVDLFVAGLEPRMVEIPTGTATLGLSRSNAKAFGWDNEFDENTTTVPAFSIDQRKVTNRQFLQFREAGGYSNRALWGDADWAWKTEHNITHPAFWKPGDRWFYRTMFEEIPLPLDWPVYVSQAEAGAYARWAGKALPTEEQWHRAAYASPDGTERPFPWGTAAPDARHGNFDLRNWDPSPVGTFPAGRSAFGVDELLGNGWEWTCSRFRPFPGFAPFSFYPGYSANFFDGQHFVMKGGSTRTAACMLRRSFRNWFQPHYQYVYAGFRCVSMDSGNQ